MPRIDVVLFDLGGVLVEVHGVDQLRGLANLDSDDELWQRWINDPWVRRFERGHCSAEEFAVGLVRGWELAISPDAFLESFRAWPVAPMTGADELVCEVRDAATVGCLSNTNALHWNTAFAHWTIFESFDLQFFSFQLGAVKPDHEIFDRVAECVVVPRGRVLLLDDNPANVEGARAAGFLAAQVRGVAEARMRLVALNVLVD